jgi:hypothetical protein
MSDHVPVRDSHRHRARPTNSEAYAAHYRIGSITVVP